MTEIKPNEWRSVAREFPDASPATLEKIGKQLQFKLAKIVCEPLPADLQKLLSELEKKLVQE